MWGYGHQHVVPDPYRPGMRYRYAVEITEWEQVAEFDPGGRRVR